MLPAITYGLVNGKISVMVAPTDHTNVLLPQAEAFELAPDVVFCVRGKRMLDILVIFLFSPIIFLLVVIIAVAVKCDSPGSVFFSQKRLTKGGKPFDIFKFRTMYETKSDAFADAQAMPNDIRITRIGHWLRRSSLDEVPQLLNVLRGEMSLIGPRPHALTHDLYFAQHVDNYWKRYAVRPGLSGWAQVNGLRGRTETIDHMRQRVEADLHYIKTRTLVMDIKILLKTFWAMLRPPQHLH